MDETRIRKICTAVYLLLGLYATVAFFVTGNLLDAIWAIGLGLTSLLTWAGPDIT